MTRLSAKASSSPPKQRRGPKKRDEILDAATAGFRDEGYESVSMDRIAELANASKRTVYNHFGSKEALFLAVVSRHVSRSLAKVAIQWNPAQAIEEQLEAFGQAKADMAADPNWIGVFRMAFGVLMRDTDIAAKVGVRAAAGEDGLVSWIEAAHRANRLAAPDAQLAADQFWALIKGSLFWPQAVALGDAPDATRRNQVIREAVKTFLARYERR